MLFYIEDPKRRDGGLMCWWNTIDMGYTTRAMYAREFTEEEVGEKLSIQMGEKIAWPRLYILAKLKGGSVSIDDCDGEEAYKPK